MVKWACEKIQPLRCFHLFVLILAALFCTSMAFTDYLNQILCIKKAKILSNFAFFLMLEKRLCFFPLNLSQIFTTEFMILSLSPKM